MNDNEFQALREENERLREALTSVAVYRGGADVARDDRDGDWRLIALRLEDIARQLIEENERLKAEANMRGLTAAQRVDSIRDLQARLSRAEEVVEAAKDHQTHPDAKLMSAIRHYEEGKA